MKSISKSPAYVRTLLLMAGDPANMQLMTQLMTWRDDWNVITAVNGKDGLQLAGAIMPDVVFMDTWLTEVSADKALKALRCNPMTSHIPVIAVSAAALATQVQAGLQAGFFRYITKPYLLTDLLEAIDCSLSKRHGQPESSCA